MYFEKIRPLIAERFDLDENIIEMDTKIIEDLGADSLDVADMLMMLEDEFDIVIPDETAEQMKTIGDLVDYLDNNA